MCVAPCSPFGCSVYQLFVVLDLGGTRRKRAIFLWPQMPQCNIILFWREVGGKHVARCSKSLIVLHPRKKASILLPTQPMAKWHRPSTFSDQRHIQPALFHPTCVKSWYHRPMRLKEFSGTRSRAGDNGRGKGGEGGRGHVPFTTQGSHP